MDNFNYLQTLIRDRLQGNEGRILELFQDGIVFNHLVSNGAIGDWLHFTPKTFDGSYFVKSGNEFHVYQQERGTVSGLQTFLSLPEAARHFFKTNGYKIQ